MVFIKLQKALDAGRADPGHIAPSRPLVFFFFLKRKPKTNSKSDVFIVGAGA